MNSIYYDYFYFYDKPIKYEGITIYPVTMDKYMEFYSSIDCLLINKNRTPDINIIKMSYLEYIYKTVSDEIEQSNGEKSETWNKFYMLMTTVLRVDYNQIFITINQNNEVVFVVNYKNEDDTIRQVIINKTKFDEIKNIICGYNLVELPDETIDPKLEKALQDAEAFRNKNSEKMGTIEDQIICVLISTSLRMEDIENLTIRKFQKILERVDYKLHYQLYKTAEMNGAEFKKKIPHWRSLIEHDRYEGLIVDYDTTVEKFQKK